MKQSIFYWALFSAIVLLGAGLRLYSITTLPCGLAPDEANNALVASRGHTAFVYNNPFNESEGFFISFVVLLSRLIGLGVWQIYAASALLGILTIIAGGLAIKKHFGHHVSLAAVFLLATSSWHIALSQSGTWTVTTPLFLGVLLLYLPTQHEKVRAWYLLRHFLLGIVFSLGFYGYLTYRTTLLVLFVYTAVFIVRQMKTRSSFVDIVRKTIRSILAFALGATAGAIPLLIGYAQNPHVAMGRTLQVLQLGQGVGDALASVTTNIVLIGKGFFIHGSDNWHQNLRGHPFLPWMFLPFFLIGLLEQVKKAQTYVRNKTEEFIPVLLVLSFVLFFLPDLLTDAAPHGARLNGEILVVYIFVGIGVTRVVRLMTRSMRSLASKYAMTGLILGASGLIFLATIQNLHYRTQSTWYARDYFCDMRDAGEYLISDNFQQLYASRVQQEVNLYIVGSDYEIGPLAFYMNWPTTRWVEFTPIPYRQLRSVRIKEGSLVVVPAFTQYGFARVHSWFREGTIDPPLTQLMENNPYLRLYLASYHSNGHWYPDNTSFLVFEVTRGE